MNKKLENKNVLITGAASGLGRALAKKLFIDEKCNVILLDKDRTNLQILHFELVPPHDSSPQQGPGCVQSIYCDVTKDGDVRQAIASIDAPHVDIVICCAGMTALQRFSESTMNGFESIVQTNLLGTARVVHACLAKMSESPSPALVILNSLAGRLAAPGMAAYCASKFGLLGFADSLRQELPRRFRVQTIHPGFVKTPILKHSLVNDQAAFNSAQKILQRYGASPDRIACLIIKAIKQEKKSVVLGVETRLLTAMERLSPQIASAIVGQAYRHLCKWGVFGEVGRELAR